MAADPKPEPRERYFWGRIERQGHHDPSARIESALYFCSNFAPATFELDGEKWPTTEHYYQAQKFSGSREVRERILSAKSGSQAKAEAYRPGLKALVRSDWDRQRKHVMRRALRAKFRQNKHLAAKLLATGDDVLHEDAPKDPYWGVCGKDKLGKLLMEVREELRTDCEK